MECIEKRSPSRNAVTRRFLNQSTIRQAISVSGRLPGERADTGRTRSIQFTSKNSPALSSTVDTYNIWLDHSHRI